MTNDDSRRESTPDDGRGRTGDELVAVIAAGAVGGLLAQGCSAEDLVSLLELLVLLRGLVRD